MSIQVTPIKKKRGGQPKHWAEIARVWTWYRFIKSKCDLSDYALDIIFAWHPDGKKEMSTDERPRTFEWIRKEARLPRGVKYKWRSMKYLVLAVDGDERFYGSQKLYDSYFWKLLQSSEHDPSVIQNLLAKLLTEYGLIRVNPDDCKTLTSLIYKYGKESVFDRCLHISVKQMTDISAITLLWAINLMAKSPQTNYIRQVTESMFDAMVCSFFNRYFKDDMSLTFYSDAIDAFINSRTGAHDYSIVGYGLSEVLSEWVILPIGISDLLDELYLYPELIIKANLGVRSNPQ